MALYRHRFNAIISRMNRTKEIACFMRKYANNAHIALSFNFVRICIFSVRNEIFCFEHARSKKVKSKLKRINDFFVPNLSLSTKQIFQTNTLT